LGEEAGRAVALRLPGPLLVTRHALDLGGRLPPLAEHGPLLVLAPRFGRTIVRHLLPRLADASLDVRFYAALAFTELTFPEAVGPLGERLFDIDSGVRRAAVTALGRFGPSPELRELVESLRGELPGPEVL